MRVYATSCQQPARKYRYTMSPSLPSLQAFRMDEAGPLFKSRPPRAKQKRSAKASLKVAGLFAGIGGIELGLHEAGHRTQLVCEIDEAAKGVLSANFPKTQIVSDIRELEGLPPVDLVTAGFPCQDLSQAGQLPGSAGNNPGSSERCFASSGKLRLVGSCSRMFPSCSSSTRGRRWDSSPRASRISASLGPIESSMPSASDFLTPTPGHPARIADRRTAGHSVRR